MEKDATEKQRRVEEDKLKNGTRICIDTEDDGWVQGEIIVIKPLPFIRGEKRNRRKYIIKTSETPDTIHGDHVVGEVGEVQLHEMDWWTVAEGGEDTDSGEDNSDGKEEGEGRRDTKKPKGTGQDTQQGQYSKGSKSGGGRVGKEHLSKSGGTRENGGVQEGGVASQRRGDNVMRMYDMIIYEMLSPGHRRCRSGRGRPGYGHAKSTRG